jgi:hypothetical protein
VRVRVWSFQVVAAAGTCEAQLEDFAFSLEKEHRFVNGGQAGRGVILPDALEDLFHRGVPFIVGKELKDGKPLRGDAVPIPAKLLHQTGQPGFAIFRIHLRFGGLEKIIPYRK